MQMAYSSYKRKSQAEVKATNEDYNLDYYRSGVKSNDTSPEAFREQMMALSKMAQLVDIMSDEKYASFSGDSYWEKRVRSTQANLKAKFPDKARVIDSLEEPS